MHARGTIPGTSSKDHDHGVSTLHGVSEDHPLRGLSRSIALFIRCTSIFGGDGSC